jgi:hypothetical protein
MILRKLIRERDCQRDVFMMGNGSGRASISVQNGCPHLKTEETESHWGSDDVVVKWFDAGGTQKADFAQRCLDDRVEYFQ